MKLVLDLLVDLLPNVVFLDVSDVSPFVVVVPAFENLQENLKELGEKAEDEKAPHLVEQLTVTIEILVSAVILCILHRGPLLGHSSQDLG